MRKKIYSSLLILFCCCLLVGCTGVEPEKRLYPQAIALDRNQEEYEVLFAMPDMEGTTGQEKSGEEKQENILAFSGKNMKEIQKLYNQTQEKYLDLGHVNVLILGTGIRQMDYWEQVMASFKSQPTLGEDIYVFQTADIRQVMEYNGTKTDSLGDYIKGIYENRPYVQQRQGVTLRQVYKVWYETGELCTLPVISVLSDGTLQIHSGTGDRHLSRLG